VGINKLNQSGIGVGGAVYGLYSDSACASLYDKLTTSADGKGTFAKSVDVGKTYYIKEITAPTGYELDDTVYPVITNEENSTHNC